MYLDEVELGRSKNFAAGIEETNSLQFTQITSTHFFGKYSAR